MSYELNIHSEMRSEALELDVSRNIKKKKKEKKKTFHNLDHYSLGLAKDCDGVPKIIKLFKGASH